MKSGNLAIFFAAVIAAVSAVVFSIIFGVIGIAVTTVDPVLIKPDWVLLWVSVVILMDVFWYTFFGLIFTRVYDIVPGKGILKGLVYSYIVFLISNIRFSVFQLAFWQCPQWLWSFNILGIFIWTVWGLALGALYKK